MDTKKILTFALPALLLAAGALAWARSRPTRLVLTGVVTTNEVVVSPQVAGQLGELLVTEGDTVKKDQRLAVIVPDELRADSAYYAQSAASVTSQVRQSEAELRFQERQTAEQIRQAESALAAAQEQAKAGAADLEQARLTYERDRDLGRQGVVSSQDLDTARTATEAARARQASLERTVEAQRAALALARSTAEQVAMKRSGLQESRHQESAAAAQQTKADVRLAYAELKAPIDGIVDVRAARVGEYLNPGQPVLTLVNPDDLWVRIDVEEGYIERIRLGDDIPVRLPSGEERVGRVVFRGVDAAYATQRDVSRTKRDIRTFEVRLRLDNADRHLALGMTAYAHLTLR
jgi:multidrug resistance efflux pump